MDWTELFQIRSRKQENEQRQQYARWAFPYGEAQKQRIASLLKDLFPQEPLKLTMTVYLLGREGYLAENTGTDQQEKLSGAVRKMLPMLPGKNRRLCYLYLALILADGCVRESLLYPEPAQLCRTAEELEAQYRLPRM